MDGNFSELITDQIDDESKIYLNLFTTLTKVTFLFRISAFIVTLQIIDFLPDFQNKLRQTSC